MNTSWNVPTIFFLAACGGESVIEKQPNTAPLIQIMSHSDGIEVQDGYVENFRAVVSDDDDGYPDLTVAWYVGEDIVCEWGEVSPAGESFCSVAFTEGDSKIIAEVRDLAGAGARAEVSFTVLPTEAPVIELISPTAGQRYYSNELIEFSALISDMEDSPEDLIVSWSSSVDGALGVDGSPNSAGEITDYIYLSEAQHAIELRVEDTSGKVSTEELVIRVQGENETPSCEITEPADLDSILLGDSVLFRGLASDANIDSTELTTVWSSDKDGELGAGTVNSAGELTFSYASLTANEHIITLRVEDEVGAACQDTIVVFVGTAPVVGVVAPSSNGVVAVGEPVLFEGTVTDQESQGNQLSVEWISSIDGTLYTGQPSSQGNTQFSTDMLSAGVHSITLSSTDPSGLTSDDVISLRVNTPPTAPTAAISPLDATSSDVLTAVATGSTDVDGQVPSYTYEWFENGVLTSYTSTMIPASVVDVNDVWTLRVTPNDGYHDGDFSEATIVISNSLPVVDTPVITSSTGSFYNDATLVCSATVSDADETVVASYTWDIAGQVAVGSSVDLTSYTIMPGDNVSCIASTQDSNGGSASSSSTQSIANRAPNVTQVSVTPTLAHSNALVTCSASVSDPDGEATSENYTWYLNGVSVGTGNTLQLDDSWVSAGDGLDCMVDSTDASGANGTSSASLIIQSGAPTFDQAATISPSTGVTQGTTLTCSAVVSDPDGGTPSLSYQWMVNNTPVGIGSTWTVSTAEASIGDSIHCLMTAVDSDSNTASSLSSPVTVDNSAPVISSVILNTMTPQTNDSLTASVMSSDADGDTVTYAYEWFKQDASNANMLTVVQSGTGSSFAMLASSLYDKDDTIYVSVTPNDGSINGSSVVSSNAVVQNTPPDTPVIALTSGVQTPQEGVDDLTCTLIGANDVDGDALTYDYEWIDPNGVIQQTNYGTTYLDDVFLGAGTQNLPGVWTCQVTIDDGTDTVVASSSILVEASGTPCGSILHEDPVQSGVPNGWVLCYIDQSDTTYHNTSCNQLLQDLNNGWDSGALLSNGGNFGCWHGNSGAEGASYASNNVVGMSCRDNIQHSTTLAAWNPSTTTMGVCIRYP